jgi:hypothetical protein
MADAAAPRSPLGPAEQRTNCAQTLPGGVKVNGKGYLARIWVPGRGWVNLKTWPTIPAAVAAREHTLERVQVEGYDWLPLPRSTKPRTSGAVCTSSPNPARPHTTDMSPTSSAGGKCCTDQQAAAASTPTLSGPTAIGPKRAKHVQCLAAAERRAAAAAAAVATVSMRDEADAWLASIPPPPSPLPRFDPLAATLQGTAHAQLVKVWAETHSQPFQATPRASRATIPFRI